MYRLNQFPVDEVRDDLVNPKKPDFLHGYKDKLLSYARKSLLGIEHLLNKWSKDQNFAFTRIQTLVVESNDGYSVYIRYKLNGVGHSVGSSFDYYDSGWFTSPLLFDNEVVEAGITVGIKLFTKYLLEELRKQVVANLNRSELNDLMSHLSPRSCPYTVSFSIEGNPRKPISHLYEDNVEFSLHQDFFLELPDLLLGQSLQNDIAYVKKTFYRSISVVDLLLNGDLMCLHGYLTGSDLPVGANSFKQIVSTFAGVFDTNRKQSSRLLYTLDNDGVVTIYNKHLERYEGKKAVYAYYVGLQVQNKTFEVLGIQNPKVFDVTKGGLVERGVGENV